MRMVMIAPATLRTVWRTLDDMGSIVGPVLVQSPLAAETSQV
jgi:hypothetical protein